MSKWIKRVLGLAAVGSAAAGLYYYLKKSSSDTTDDDMDEFEDEDFDLDNDLKPVGDREYVPLTPLPGRTAKRMRRSLPIKKKRPAARTKKDA